MEGPLGAGDINRVGAPRVDGVASAATGSGAQPPRGECVVCGENRGRGVEPVSAAALGVGGHHGTTARVATVAGRASLSGRLDLGAGELEVSGVWGRGGAVGAQDWQSAVRDLGCRDRLRGWTAA